MFKKALLLFFILWVSMPMSGFASEELAAIKEKAPTNRIYDRAMEFFTQKMPEEFEKRLSNSSRYIDMIIDIFNEKGIPLDIAYLPLIESEFSPAAIGRGDAVGLWQFVKTTARRYGLRIDKYVDERKDPVKSTYAAADYLSDLYSTFGAWDIVLAAYNAGEGKIKRMVNTRKSERLPGGVYRYLAYFVAASTVAQEPEKYGFELREDMRRDETDHREIRTDRMVSLKTLAEKFHTTVTAIKGLNPALLSDVTPPYPFLIRLPEN